MDKTDIEKTPRYANMMLKKSGFVDSSPMPHALPNRAAPHRIGVDLGGTKIEIAVLDAQHQWVWRHREPTPSHDYQEILSAIAQLVAQARERWQAMPPEAFPVTVRLRRSDAATMCTMALKVLKDESVLTVPAAQKRLHLYVVGASGQITTTERVPIR